MLPHHKFSIFFSDGTYLTKINSPKNIAGNGAISYKVTVEEYNGGPSQLFKYRKAGTDKEGDAIFNIVSVKYPNLYLSFATCSKNADMLLLQPNTDAGEQHQEWIIKGSPIVNLCEKNDANE